MSTPVPALHQSLFEVMRCPESYVAQVFDGLRLPDSLQSERGTEIHAIMSKYVEHCASQRVSSDWTYFDSLVTAVGPESGPILQGLRDSYSIDHAHVLTTELYLAMDEDLNPIDMPHLSPFVSLDHASPEGTEAAHGGTLDVVLLFDDDSATIDDYKSHPQAFDPETYQGMLYPFMVMKYFPHIRRVTFRLRFVRYANLTREVTWEREQMPEMELSIRQARGRQKFIHATVEAGGAVKPFSHQGCHYCPKMVDFSCSVAEFNPEINMTMEQRAVFSRFYSMMSAQNNKVLKNHVQATGRPIELVDGTGQRIAYGEQEVAKRVYPLDKTLIKILDDYTEASGEDWQGLKLAVSSTTLTPKLKTKKRAGLQQVIEDSHLEMKPGVRYTFAILNNDGSREVDTDPYAYGIDE